MKLKKVTALCHKSKHFCLYDKIDSTGAITQWLGDGCAIYPLYGLPILNEETICAVFDISEKQRDSISIKQATMPEDINTDDTDAEERAAKEDEISIFYNSSELQPLRTSRGITFIQRKYLDPLDDVMGMVQLFERTTASGQPYIVAKAGLLIAAVIMPYSIKERLITQLEEIVQECRRVLKASPQADLLETDNIQSGFFEE